MKPTRPLNHVVTCNCGQKQFAVISSTTFVEDTVNGAKHVHVCENRNCGVAFFYYVDNAPIEKLAARFKAIESMGININGR